MKRDKKNKQQKPYKPFDSGLWLIPLIISCAAIIIAIGAFVK